VNVKEYISSGIIESYVMGLATEAERQEFEANCLQYPEIAEARNVFEMALEIQLLTDARQPPQHLKQQIQEKLTTTIADISSEEQEEESTPVRRMGIWKWVAAASLILLAGAAYWALSTNKKYQDLRAQNNQIQTQLDQSNQQIADMQRDIEMVQHSGMKTAALKNEDNSRTFATIYWDTASTSKDVYLLINNLPQPASDKQYQLWALLNGQPIDLGMIEVKKRLLYQMKNVQNAQAFAITLEPKGGSAAPTGTPIAISKL
jgi:anti-sigma-K factor RskA